MLVTTHGWPIEVSSWSWTGTKMVSSPSHRRSDANRHSGLRNRTRTSTWLINRRPIADPYPRQFHSIAIEHQLSFRFRNALSGRFLAATANHGHECSKTEEQEFIKLLNSKEKVVKLQFYLQDALGGPNATVREVARSQITALTATSFGQVRVLDDLITAEPDRNSEKLGRAQGMITFTGLEGSALTMNLNFYFTSGKYKGSTLCIVGRNPISTKNRELPIVGGTGVFRMARGYSISNTYSYDAVANYGVLEYIVYVAYPDQGCDAEINGA